MFWSVIISLIACFAYSYGKTPQKVFVGTYLHNVESIDMASNSYYLNFYMWFKWKGDIDPTKSFSFLNSIDKWGITITPVFDSVITLADSFQYQRFHVEGRFFHKFWLGTFPLDWQKILFEVITPKYPKNELVFVPDTLNSAVNEELQIPGWRILKTYNQVKNFSFHTNFGMDTTQTNVYSRYRFGIKIHRPLNFFLNKVLPPVFITILCCILIFSLNVSYVDARVSTAIGALLTEVFLQLSFTGNLPNVGIMLLLDHIFNFSYFIILLILVIILYTTYLLDKKEAHEDEHERKRLTQKIRRIDRLAMLGLSLFFVIGVFVITYLVRGYLFNFPS